MEAELWKIVPSDLQREAMVANDETTAKDNPSADANCDSEYALYVSSGELIIISPCTLNTSKELLPPRIRKNENVMASESREEKKDDPVIFDDEPLFNVFCASGDALIESKGSTAIPSASEIMCICTGSASHATIANTDLETSRDTSMPESSAEPKEGEMTVYICYTEMSVKVIGGKAVFFDLEVLDVPLTLNVVEGNEDVTNENLLILSRLRLTMFGEEINVDDINLSSSQLTSFAFIFTSRNGKIIYLFLPILRNWCFFYRLDSVKKITWRTTLRCQKNPDK